MKALLKKEVVLHLKKAASFFTRSFHSEYENEEDVHPLVLNIDEETWADFGKPETVTVTIEPGDKLNPSEDEPENMPQWTGQQWGVYYASVALMVAQSEGNGDFQEVQDILTAILEGEWDNAST